MVLAHVKTLSLLLVQLTFCVNYLPEVLQATLVLNSMMKSTHLALVFMVKLVVNKLVLVSLYLRVMYLVLFPYWVVLLPAHASIVVSSNF